MRRLAIALLILTQALAAQNAQVWKLPPFYSDGLLSMSFRVPVPAGDANSLAIRAPREASMALPDEIRVNGVKVGSHGSFPPAPYVAIVPATTVFNLPPGTAVPGQTALVEWRVWYPPFARIGAGTDGFRFTIGPRELLRLEERNAIAEDRLSLTMQIVVNFAEFLLGAALIVLWRQVRGARDVFWFGVYLLTTGAQGLWHFYPRLFRPDLPLSTGLFWDRLLIWLFMGFALFEFQWETFAIGRRWPLRVLQTASAIGLVLLYFAQTAGTPTPTVRFCAGGSLVLLIGTEGARALISLWNFVRSPRTRAVAAAMIAWSTVLILGESGISSSLLPNSFLIGPITVFTNEIAEVLIVATVVYLLLRRLLGTWRRSRELDAEFEAARQMQHLLVPAAVDVPGFALASAYLPSKEVGGDFFWSLPAADGSLLLVAGDVSGKGLPAAMTVATIAGALRNEPARGPALVLARLNAVLVGHGGAGFTTCCAALFTGSQVVVANAGHVPPYCNGEELEVAAGLPLGVIGGLTYDEIAHPLHPGDAITFVSDGVPEARDATLELYGFERTRAVSTQSASAIAEAARAFGQQDDITVVTVRLELSRSNGLPSARSAA